MEASAPTLTVSFDHYLPTCLVTDTEDTEATILVGQCEARNKQDFGTGSITFGVDNCATQHICSVPSLFRERPTPHAHLGVKGISGTKLAQGTGTIQFTIKDDDGITEK